MPLEGIQRYLKKMTGLESDSVGGTIVERGVRQRMDVSDISSISEYLKLIQESPVELQQLINEITVPETWFYRDYKPFLLLEEFAKCFLKSKSPSEKLRVLSVPCSSGEEAYSIAMTLLDAGFATDQFHIDALDISTAVLEKAKKGVYGRNSFRGEYLDYRSRYFLKLGKQYSVNEELLSSVNFQHGNILELGFGAECDRYDVIFCRNLLIYFGLENKKKSLKQLHALLADRGLLFLGHAETGRMAEGLFVTAGAPGAFAYRKQAIPDETSTRAVLQPPRLKKRNFRSLSSIQTKVSSNIQPLQEPVVSSVNEAKSLELNLEEQLAIIESLADRGEVEKAGQLCGELLEKHPTEPQCYYLRGIIQLAQHDDAEAVESFRRTLYLDSNHYQALIHLSVLADKQGDERAAQNYRSRALRVAQSEAGK